MFQRHVTSALLALSIATGVHAQYAPPPVYQQASPGNPGWSVDPVTGCWVWNQEPRAGETVYWRGDCGSDGRASGNGVAEWHGREGTQRYQGPMLNGKRDGQGVYSGQNGVRYEGGFKDDQFDGRGTYLYANGNRYEGEWREGRFHGQGVFTGAQFGRYEGQFTEG